MDNAPVALAIAVLPSVLTAAIAALGLWLAERRKDRDAALRRLRAIEEETAHLSYLRGWLETQQLAGPADGVDLLAARTEVCGELLASRDRLSQAFVKDPESEAPPALQRAWWTAALIPLHRPAARAVRWGYYSCLLLAVINLAFSFWVGYSEGSSFLLSAVIAAIAFLPWFVFSLGFRAWARTLERRLPRSTGSPQGKTPVYVAPRPGRQRGGLASDPAAENLAP